MAPFEALRKGVLGASPPGTRGATRGAPIARLKERPSPPRLGLNAALLYVCYTDTQMGGEGGFEWDDANRDHVARHGVTPDETEQALLNDPISLEYQTDRGEPRWVSVGPTDATRFLVVVWTVRGPAIRVVTAYPANRRLMAVYRRTKEEPP